MSKLFELYVLGLLKDRFGAEVTYHVNAHYQELDYLITKKGEEMVVDAKYKPSFKKNPIKEDMRQVSGYARLDSVYDQLSVDKDKVIDCLIIYPDMENGKTSFVGVDLKIPESEIKGWNRFYKVGVKLPLI
jgi:5-methylcytosine-specific restriction endonuclease McrBC regulatory subunit McrC